MNEVVDMLHQVAMTRPETAAVIDVATGEQISYATLDSRATTVSNQLGEHEVNRTDRIGLRCHRSIETIVQIHAINRTGAIVVPFDPSLSDARIESRAKCCNVSMILDPVDSSAESITVQTYGDSEHGRTVPENEKRDAHSDVRCLLFTSGTTGKAAPVPLTAQNLETSAWASALRLGVLPSDRWINPLSLAQMGGIAPIYRAVHYGTGVILTPFDQQTIRSAIIDDGGTGISLVPTMLRKLLDNDVPLDRCRVVLVGGDRTDPGLVDRSLDQDVPLYVTYGMTEAASQLATATPSELSNDPTTVGRPLRGTAIRIDKTDEDAVGEILATGRTIAPAAYHDIRVDRVDLNGTLRTGDSGYRDEDGRLFVTGRLDERIVSGGQTIDPLLVEARLRDIPLIEDAAVVGIPDDTWGELVAALIQVDERSKTTIEAVAATVDSKLPSGEKPRRLLERSTVPRTPAGTIDRKRVRTLLESADPTEYTIL